MSKTAAERRVDEAIRQSFRRAYAKPAAPRPANQSGGVTRRVNVSATGAQRRAAVRRFSASMPGRLSTDPAFLMGATMAAVERKAAERQAAAGQHRDRILSAAKR